MRKSTFLEIHLYISDFFSTFRYDVSESEVILTQADPMEVGFALGRQSRIYNHIRRECEYIRFQAKKIELDDDIGNLLDTKQQCMQIFQNYIQSDKSDYFENIVGKAIDLANKNERPYAG